MVVGHKNKTSLQNRLEIVAALWLLCCSVFAYGDQSLAINGQWFPGAMLQGTTYPHAEVTVLGQSLIADEQGEFVFGLGRDVKGEVAISVAYKGREENYSYTVRTREYDIQRITGVDQKYVSPPSEVKARISREAGQIWTVRQTNSAETYFRQAFTWPAQGPVTGVYGSQRVFNGEPKRPHYGLDIAGPVGTKITAPAGGVVLLVGDMYYSGGTLIIDHGYGISSTFIHLSEILVTEGQRVSQGEEIAKMGATGRATGSHLDWRVNWFNQRLDPYLLLPASP